MEIMVKSIDDHEWIPNTEQIIALIRHWYPEYKISDEEYEKLDKFINKERNNTEERTLSNCIIKHSLKCNIENYTHIVLDISIIKNISDSKDKYVSIISINEYDFYKGMKNWINF